MKRKIRRITIICEGYEEFDYLMCLLHLGLWNEAYTVRIKNAKSLTNIPPVYQSEYQNDNADLIVVFCDTEMYPYEQFRLVCDKIDRFHDKRVSRHIVFFSNPCTMQVQLSHFAPVSLESNSKHRNSPLIRELTGVENYRARDEQRRLINRQITRKNYYEMKSNLERLSRDYRVKPSTNFITLLNYLENPDPSWVRRLANRL